MIDNPFRDLPGLILVARRLAAEGALCFLVPMNLRESEIWALAPDFVLLNHLRTIYEDLVSRLMWAGIRVGVLDTEGSVYSPAAGGEAGGDEDADLDEYALAMMKNDRVRRKVPLYCAWTPRFAAYAERKGWYAREQLAVTGHPRMDLYAPRWRAASLGIQAAAEGFSDNLIMINGSFAFANSAFQTPEQEMAMLVDKMSYPREYAEQWIRAQQAALKGLTSMANALAQAYPSATFVYRPHPFEGESVYKELLEPLPNLHFIKKGTVDGWLLRAKALVHWGSSTAIDACLAGIPALSPAWLPAFPPVPSVETVSIRCADEAEMKRQVGDVLSGQFEMPEALRNGIDKVVERTFYRIDGSAHERVADAILAVVRRRGPKPSLRRCWSLTPKVEDKSPRGRITRTIRDLCGIPHMPGGFRKAQRRAEEWPESAKQFDMAEVQRIAGAFASCEGNAAGDGLRIESSEQRGDYRLSHASARSVTLTAEDQKKSGSR